MNAYITQIRMGMRLTLRDRGVLFFAFAFPLIFFFLFGQLSGAGEKAGVQVVNMVLTIGVLGNGFFGAGMRAVSDREQGILRRFKVAPISAAPILVSSLVTGLVLYIPLVILILSLAHFLYGMEWPTNLGSVLLFVSIGLIAFRALGGMIAAVANSAQESQILIQMLYFPMLFLGGGTFPVSILPMWAQTLGQFLPSTYLSLGLSGILRGSDSILDNLPAVGGLLTTLLVATFLGVKLFRWEKDEKLKASAKLWLLAVLAPFIAMGIWQAQAKTNIAKAKTQERTGARERTRLIRNVRVFVGDGSVLERASVMVKHGKIAEIYTGDAPDAKSLHADELEGAGKTLLPGLIDVHVHLGAAGGFSDDPKFYEHATENMRRELAAYLFSGVTAVKSVGDSTTLVLAERGRLARGEGLGAELFAVGPMFTTEGGHGAEMLKYLPSNAKDQIVGEMLRLPKTSDEARTEVANLAKLGVDGIKMILEGGGGSTVYNRLDTGIAKAIGEAGRAVNLPVVSHTGEARDIADALDAGVVGIEHGSMRDLVPPALFARMKAAGVFYDPTLAVQEAIESFISGDLSMLDRSMIQQAAPPELLKATKRIAGPAMEPMRASYRGYPLSLEASRKNLLAAYAAGVPLTAGTDAGNPLMFHGPGIHRELQLWVAAGIPPAVALQAATLNNAKLLRVDNRIGLIRKGYEASMLIVDGNPLQYIAATERISSVFLKGERVDRSSLFDKGELK